MVGLVGLIIILITIFTSFKGFKDRGFFNANSFQVEKVLTFREYHRIISSGFIHADWKHLLFNMISLYIFSDSLEGYTGSIKFLLIYFSGLLGGSLFALYINRFNGAYTAIGASGAVCGVIFASIALFPGMELGLLLLPVTIPGWLFGFLYILVTIYGIKSKTDNIGHEAHFGGALIGLAVALALYPYALRYNYLPIILIIAPSCYFIYLLIKRPHSLITGRILDEPLETVDDRYNAYKNEKQKELDYLLDKIHEKGIEKLSPHEKERLNELSK